LAIWLAKTPQSAVALFGTRRPIDPKGERRQQEVRAELAVLILQVPLDVVDGLDVGHAVPTRRDWA
jgi:hypothetical protein